VSIHNVDNFPSQAVVPEGYERMVIDLTQLLPPALGLRSAGRGPRHSGAIHQPGLRSKAGIVGLGLSLRDSMWIRGEGSGTGLVIATKA